MPVQKSKYSRVSWSRSKTGGCRQEGIHLQRGRTLPQPLNIRRVGHRPRAEDDGVGRGGDLIERVVVLDFFDFGPNRACIRPAGSPQERSSHRHPPRYACEDASGGGDVPGTRSAPTRQQGVELAIERLRLRGRRPAPLVASRRTRFDRLRSIRAASSRALWTGMSIEPVDPPSTGEARRTTSRPVEVLDRSLSREPEDAIQRSNSSSGRLEQATKRGGHVWGPGPSPTACVNAIDLAPRFFDVMSTRSRPFARSSAATAAHVTGRRTCR